MRMGKIQKNGPFQVIEIPFKLSGIVQSYSGGEGIISKLKEQ